MGGSRAGWAIGLAVAVLGAAPLPFHTELKSSSPAKDERLAAPPAELKLTYTTAVEPAVAQVRLRGGDAPVALGPIARGETTADLVVPVDGRMVAGTYTVEWQVLGTDGHPVSGTFSFVVEVGDEPPVASPVAPSPELAGGEVGDPETAVDAVQSPSFIAARWLTFASLVSLLGAVAFRVLVLGPLARAGAEGAVVSAAAWRAGVFGAGAALFLAMASMARLLLQVDAMSLGGFGPTAGDLVGATLWGRGWLLQVTGALVAAGSLHFAARQWSAGWWGVAGVAGVVAAVGSSLSGHPAAVEGLAGLAVTVDTLHVLAVSAWLGTLLLVMAAGLPAIVREGVEGDRSASVARMVSTFSPRALVAAGLVVLTGAGSALIQLGGIGPLFTTTYGRTLLVKVGIVTVVVAAGLNNWKRTKPGLERGADAGTLRAPATIELLGAALVLLVTAILVALPPH